MIQLRLTLATVLLLLCSSANAQDGPVVIDVKNPNRGLYPIAIPEAVNSDPALAREAAEIHGFDLSVSGWFKVIDRRSYLANLKAEGLNIEPRKWKDVGAFGVVKSRVTSSAGRLRMEFRLYEVAKGKTPVLSRVYQGNTKDLRSFTHQWSGELVRYFTGEDGFFGSKIAFVTKTKTGKKILGMDYDGKGVYGLTRNRYINILPAWSPGGSKLAFTSYMRDNPDLYVVGARGGRPKRITRYPGMNTGASWSPDGSKIALTLSKDGNPEIYVIDAKSGRVLRRLTRNRGIDTSPAWSPDGGEIAFVSSREGGNPQIYVMKASGGGARRVSMNGSYNTTPTWSPRKGERMLAYTTRAKGRFDIVTLDLKTKKYTRITQNEGNNEEPSFAPNGRAIAFASIRRGGSGIYIANADGSGRAQLVWRGLATSVDWSR